MNDSETTLTKKELCEISFLINKSSLELKKANEKLKEIFKDINENSSDEVMKCFKKLYSDNENEIEKKSKLYRKIVNLYLSAKE